MVGVVEGRLRTNYSLPVPWQFNNSVLEIYQSSLNHADYVQAQREMNNPMHDKFSGSDMKLFNRGALRSVAHGRVWRRLAVAPVALSLTLALGVAIASPAGAEAPAQAERKHTGDLSVTAVCNKQTGNYDFTAQLTLSRVPSGNTGSTMWRLGTSSFEGTPSSANGMERGPISSNGNTTLTLGTWSLPGTTTGNGPWVYAYTKWSPDNYGKGADGQFRDTLKGDCKQSTASCEKASPTYVWGPNVVSITGGKPGTWLSLWDARDKAHQTLIGKVKIGADCTATQTVPPAECKPHQYQGDHSSTEPPATITDTTGDGLADVPGFIAGQVFTVPGNSSLCTPPPPTDACPNLPGDQPSGFQCEPKTEHEARQMNQVPDCEAGTITTLNQERTRTQEFVNGQWVWGAWSEWTTTSSSTTPVPPGTCVPPPVYHPQGKVRAYCVTQHWGEGVAALMNKQSTQAVRFHIVRSGKDRFVTVRAGKNVRIELRHLRVGSVVKIKVGQLVLDRAKVKGGCSSPPDSHTGFRTGTERAAAG